MSIDGLDARLIVLLTDEARIGVLEASRRLGVARGTVQARLDRLQRTGVIVGFGPEIDPAALGFTVMAFATVQIRQGRGPIVAEHLAGIDEVLEVHTITGDADMLARIVARSHEDLQRVIDRLVAHPDIVRTSTNIALTAHVRYRTAGLVQASISNDQPTAGLS